MAYSPLGQGRLLRQRALQRIAAHIDATPAQVALAWLLAKAGIAAIPQAAELGHSRECASAQGLALSSEVMAELEETYPPPSGPTPLEIL